MGKRKSANYAAEIDKPKSLLRDRCFEYRVMNIVNALRSHELVIIGATPILIFQIAKLSSEEAKRFNMHIGFGRRNKKLSFDRINSLLRSDQIFADAMAKVLDYHEMFE